MDTLAVWLTAVVVALVVVSAGVAYLTSRHGFTTPRERAAVVMIALVLAAICAGAVAGIKL